MLYVNQLKMNSSTEPLKWALPSLGESNADIGETENSSSQRVSNALLFAANKVEQYSYMGCCLQIEEPTKPLFFFVPESIPRKITLLCSALDPASMLCYDISHYISETHFAKNLTEKLSFSCG